jgi:hypothetical protein
MSAAASSGGADDCTKRARLADGEVLMHDAIHREAWNVAVDSLQEVTGASNQGLVEMLGHLLQAARQKHREEELRRVFGHRTLQSLGENMERAIITFSPCKSLLRLSQTSMLCQTLITSPGTWQGQFIDFHRGKGKTDRGAITKSARLSSILTSGRRRWLLVRHIKLPAMWLASYLWREIGETFPNLTVLDARHVIHFDAGAATKVCKQLPHLETLLMPGACVMPPTSLVHFSTLRSLQHLNMAEGLLLHQGSNGFQTPATIQGLKTLDVSLGLLCTSLELHDIRTNDDSVSALRHLPELLLLNLSDIHSLTDQALQEISRFPKLQELVICNMGPGITRQGLVFLRACRSLKRLNLSDCAKRVPLANERQRTMLERVDINEFHSVGRHCEAVLLMVRLRGNLDLSTVGLRPV